MLLLCGKAQNSGHQICLEFANEETDINMDSILWLFLLWFEEIKFIVYFLDFWNCMVDIW